VFNRFVFSGVRCLVGSVFSGVRCLVGSVFSGVPCLVEFGV
jgi:hypothetical protein